MIVLLREWPTMSQDRRGRDEVRGRGRHPLQDVKDTIYTRHRLL